MKAYLFPGQGAQFEGMGKDLYESNSKSKAIFEQADDILGFSLSDVMFNGSAEDLKATKITQPALFVHSMAVLYADEKEIPAAVAGHSLGEFSALVANGVLSFEDGLKLVFARAMAMQKACDAQPGTMAAILGLDDEVVERICNEIDGIVVPANYNCPGQLVISGSVEGIHKAVEAMTAAGAKRALVLPVGGAFHSPLMAPAKEELQEAIYNTTFLMPKCPVYQNVTAKAESDPEVIQTNLVNQLTGSVRWTQTIQQMVADNILSFVEVGGSGKVLSGLVKKVDRTLETSSF